MCKLSANDMVRYSSHLIVKEFARPPPSGEATYTGMDAAHQLPTDALCSKLEAVTLTRYPSIAFREEWRWTCDYEHDRMETLTLLCAPIRGDSVEKVELLQWLMNDYVRGRLERCYTAMSAALPRRKRGVRHFDDRGNFGDWQRIERSDAAAFRFETPSPYNHHNTLFARDMDLVLRGERLPYLPGDHLRVEYRPPLRTT